MAAAVELSNLGFQQLSVWEIRNGKAKPKTTEWDDVSGWIYAFVAEDEVKYVGIATTILRSRFDGYSYQINDTVGSKILALLRSGVEVQIWGTRRSMASKEQLQPEESRLIAELSPQWNVRK